MKRRGFFIPVIVFFVLFALLAVGFIVERATAKFRITTGLIRDNMESDVSYLGMKHAEDWLISSVLSGDFPLARPYFGDTDPMARIEAVRSDGNAAVWAPATVSLDTKLYIADVDYEPGLFTGNLATSASTPFIPRIPGIETKNAICRFYYLRSSSMKSDGKEAVTEELLAISMDKTQRNMVAKRLFYRNRNLPK
jgi:hypothetical protein